MGKFCRCTGEQKVKLGQRFESKSNVIKSAKKEGDGSQQFHFFIRNRKIKQVMAIGRADQDTGSLLGNRNEEQITLILGNDGKLLPNLANTG